MKSLLQRKKWKKADDRFYQLDEAWALRARFLRTAENVALEANLPKVAKPEIVSRFEKLEELERGFLGQIEGGRKD